jgi:putative ABC transport system permease protein
MFYTTALVLGLAFGAMALGVFLSMRIFSIPDITTDGSFTLGGAVTAVGLVSGWPALVLLPAAMLAGGLAGAATGCIHTRLKVNALLAGILVMTGLYSVNLAVLGRPNVPLIGTGSLFQLFPDIGNETVRQLIVLSLLIASLWTGLRWLLRTDFGLSMRATGNNETMIRALGVNTDGRKVLGLAFANGLTALSGSLIVQVQGFADINMGIGIVILGLGAVMIGESLLRGAFRNRIGWQLFSVIAGSLIFRLLLAFALSMGIDALWLKLVVALFVLLVIALPKLKPAR